MGIHTGEPVATGERYVGLGVHRAARICAAGHGGQVLVSQTTRELLRDDPLPDVSLRDLGEQRLKDLDEPERVYQLVAPGLQETFPPLETAAPTPFAGREGELAEAAAEELAKRWRRPGRRTLAIATFAAAAVGVAIGVLLTQGGGSNANASVEPNSVGVIDPASGRIASTIRVGASPGGLATGAGALWVVNTGGKSVMRVDPTSNAVRQTIEVGEGPAAVTVGGGAVWVTNGLDGTVSRIDPETNRNVQKVTVGNGPVGIAYGEGAVWVANSVDGTISRIDPGSGRPTRTVPAAPGASAVAVGFGRVWVVSPATGAVVALDPKSGTVVDSVTLGGDPVAVAAGGNAVWVASRGNNTVSRIDPRALAVTDTIPVGRSPVGLAATQGSVWVSNAADGTLMRIDAAEDRVVKTVELANPPQAITVSNGGGVYVAVRSNGREHRGGVLHVIASSPDSIDPAVAYSTDSWAILSMTNDGLVGYRRSAGIEGVELVPDLAISLPSPTDDGRTYTFRLRPGLRYSNGRFVKPADVRASVERLFEVPHSPAPQYYGGIVGADRCRPNRTCDLRAGIATDAVARTLTFHLKVPDGDFLAKLALPFADVVPAGAPPHDVGARPLPATGPYRIASYRENRSTRLVRNPLFREWSADAQPDGYPDVVAFRATDSDALSRVRVVEQGSADVAVDLSAPPLAKEQLKALVIQHASQLHLDPAAVTFFYFLNTRVPPFDDLRVRRAVNEAFDRAAFARLLGPGYAATCQILPPNFPSYHRTCPYGAGGAAALDRSRRLVKEAGVVGSSVTVWVPTNEAVNGRFVVRLLDSLGFKARLKSIRPFPNIGPYFGHVLDPSTRSQIGFYGWGADFPSVTGFLQPLTSCTGFSRNPAANQDPSEFCDPAVDRLLAAAARAQSENPAAAPTLWQRAEREVLAQSPLVPTANRQDVTFVAKRVGNYQHHPQWGVLLDQLWVK
jgi:YVTN family beta-propeller protein